MAKKAFNQLKNKKKIRVSDITILRKDGERVNIDVQSSCFNIGGNILIKSIFIDMTEQKRLQEQLKKAKVELEARVMERTMELEEANTTLKVLMSQLKKEKFDTEEKILTNLQGQVLPYIHNLMKEPANSKQKEELKILEKNFQGIMSKFLIRLQSNVAKFTPKEIQVANFIKDGMSTKDIARLMNISTKTIDIFRYNIRKKLGLNNKNINLRSHLCSL